MIDGFVARYLSHDGVDGLPPGEGAFLPCTFWLADNLHLQGREAEARKVFERLLDPLQRRGLDFGGIRSANGPIAGQLPAGVYARRPRKHGTQPVAGTGAGRHAAKGVIETRHEGNTKTGLLVFPRASCLVPRFHPAAQHLRNAPGLGNTPAGRIWRFCIENLADRADAALTQVRNEALQSLPTHRQGRRDAPSARRR